ncbi:MAG: amylo-alpha-1,6-glucosidase [Prochloraceae cyanobacterium]
MNLNFGREICGNLTTAEKREWLVTNGIGGYACGTVAGILTRTYHGLLVAALNPPVNRTLLLTKLNETIHYDDRSYHLYSDRWADGSIEPQGHIYLENFRLDGTIPVWQFACADLLLEKRIWMQQGENTTYIRYTCLRGSMPLNLAIAALVNYRQYHGNTHHNNWQMAVESIDPDGIRIEAFPEATNLYLFATSDRSKDNFNWEINPIWQENFSLAVEKYRGLDHLDDNLRVATINFTVEPGESLTIVASTKKDPQLNSQKTLKSQQDRDRQILDLWHSSKNLPKNKIPDWIDRLVLAANQFIVDRPSLEFSDGKTIIAGYPWFTDWGRDTMISLPGLTIATGRVEIARKIIETFAKYIDRGMLPNVFPDAGTIPGYNTVDATLWYFEAIRAYYQATSDRQFLAQLFPLLTEIIDWHVKGTRYNIHLDKDGLIYAGNSEIQLTWMDAKVDNWVVTPRTGKAIEINALWYNALVCTIDFAKILGKNPEPYQQMAAKTKTAFQRFWSDRAGYCYDVLDSPTGDDLSLRPNQILALSLPQFGSALLDRDRQRSVIDKVARNLLTSYGLRSLDPNDPNYIPSYGGDRLQRDGAYHQGTSWGWLIGHFVQAHLKVYQNPVLARSFLEPMANHIQDGCIGNISEIFDGDPPFKPRGCFAQAWSVAEVLRAWLLTFK